MAREFDEVDDYVVISDPVDGSLDLPRPLTIMAWIRPDDGGQQNNGRIIDKGGGSGSDGWTFAVRTSGTQLQLYLNGGAGANNMTSNNAGWIADTWTHAAVAYTTGGTATFYRNGVAWGSDGADLADDPVANTDDVLIGARDTDKNREFDGEIAHVQLFNTNLTQNEIMTLMNHPGAVSRGLVGWWPLLGTSTEPDWSTNGNNSSSISGTTVADNPPCGPWIGFDMPFAPPGAAAPAPARRIFLVT